MSVSEDTREIRLGANDARSLFAHKTSNRTDWLTSVTTAVEELLKGSATAIRDLFLASDLVEFAQCINANAHAIMSASIPLGFGMFPLVAMLNHSCKPNCMYSSAPQHPVEPETASRGPAYLQVRVTSKVQRGDELCVRYSDIYRSFNQRQETIKAERFFSCACARCRIVGAERELAGIRCQTTDGCRGYVYLQLTPQAQAAQQQAEVMDHDNLVPWHPMEGLPPCRDVLGNKVLSG